jgi:hypothetical protein
MDKQEKIYTNFADFYQFYLKEHSNPINRVLHLIGSTSALLVLLYIVATGRLSFFPVALLIGYGFAWVGHFVFEKNKPATFKYPFYSFASDWVMWFQVLSGQRGLTDKSQ